MVGGRKVLAGAARLMAERGVDVGVFGERAAEWGNQGKTPIFVAVDGRAAAMMAVTDPVKPSAVAAIAALHAQGLKTAMITGDNRHTAQAVARELGIDEVRAEVLPDGKVAAITALREDGRKVAFVGDGINDAPALAAADTGIAIGTGTDVAIEAASVVLMAEDLNGVPNAIALSRATLANIRQNLFWAFAYNAALIPLAGAVSGLRPVAVADLRRRRHGAVQRLRAGQRSAPEDLPPAGRAGLSPAPDHTGAHVMNIGQAAQATGISAKMIRYYESIGLIGPALRTESGYRVYGDHELHTLRFVRRARDLGFSVEQMNELLALWRDRSRASADVKRIALEHVQELERKAEALRDMAATLKHLAQNCHGDGRPDCPILEGLQGIDPLRLRRRRGCSAAGGPPRLFRGRAAAPRARPRRPTIRTRRWIRRDPCAGTC